MEEGQEAQAVCLLEASRAGSGRRRPPGGDMVPS